MRITRQLLIKTARDHVAQRLRQNRRLVCIYLTGSLLEEEPLLGGCTDIDLFFIHDSEPEMKREIIRLTDEISLDISHHSQTLFHQPRHLRLDPWLGPFICKKPLVLHDTQHWFEFTEASIGAQFYDPENILQRVRLLQESARQEWLDLHISGKAASPEAVAAYLDILEKAGNAIASLTGLPLTERRFMQQFPQRAQAIHRPDLSAGLVNLAMATPVTEESWQAWQPAWQAAFAAASHKEGYPLALSACRWPYYDRAARELWQTTPAAAVWVVLRTWTQALLHLGDESQHLAPWQAAAGSLSLTDGFETRLEAVDAYLDKLEEMIDTWAASNGL